MCGRTQELNSRVSCGGGWGLAGGKVTHTGTCWVLHPPATPRGIAGDPRREQARVSQQGECGAGKPEGVSRSFLSSLTSRRTLSEQTGCSPCGEDLLRCLFLESTRGTRAARDRGGRSDRAAATLCACAGFPWRRGRESETPPCAPPKSRSPGSVCAALSPSPQDLFFVVCIVESVYDLVRTLGIQR